MHTMPAGCPINVGMELVFFRPEMALPFPVTISCSDSFSDDFLTCCIFQLKVGLCSESCAIPPGFAPPGGGYPSGPTPYSGYGFYPPVPELVQGPAGQGPLPPPRGPGFKGLFQRPRSRSGSRFGSAPGYGGYGGQACILFTLPFCPVLCWLFLLSIPCFLPCVPRSACMPNVLNKVTFFCLRTGSH